MRIEKLSLNKIKVTVNTEDLAVYDISRETMSPESPRLRAFILALMKRAERELGFQAPAGNVLIEAIAQGEELVFLITRVESQSAVQTPKPALSSEEKKARIKKGTYRAVEKATVQKTQRQYYRFDALEGFAALLQATTLPKTAMLYKSEDCYYLALPCTSTKAKQINNLMPEFAVPVQAQNVEPYLKEHAKIIARGGEFDKILACFR